METFYTIIKISTNSYAGDSISIGLLLCQDKKYFLKFSDEKKAAAKKLLDENSEVTDFVVKQITQFVQKANSTPKKDNELFPIASLLNSDYFKYLNTYSNGILQFSKPAFLNDKVDNKKFEKLFSLMIEKHVEPDLNVELIKKQNEQFYNTVQRKLIKKVKNKIHTQIKIDSSYVPNLYFSYEMDCIGLNGALIGAKALPFTKSTNLLDRDISHYMAFIYIVTTMYKKKAHSSFYLIADEPPLNTSEHKTFTQIQNNPLFKVIPSQEADMVAEKVVETKSKKFLVKETI